MQRMILQRMILLSLVLPMALLSLTGWKMGQPQPWAPVKSVQDQQAKLAQAKPEVVVVGNSKAISDIDGRLLGRLLGEQAGAQAGKPLRVAQIKEDGSPAGMWYALLKYRVFGEGHRPKLVVAVGMLDAMLQARILPPKGPMVLGWHTADPDAALLSKGLGAGDSATLARIQQQRGAWRAGLLDGMKYRAAGWAGSTAEQTDAALAQIFGEDAVKQDDGHARVLPVVEAQAEGAGSASVRLEDTFLPDLARLCAEYGAKLVLVRAPLPASSTEDRYRPDQIRPVLELLNALGVGWLDYRSALPDTMFKDVRHLGTDGRAKLTERLAADLLALGAGGDPAGAGGGAPGALRAARLPLVPDRAERSGTPPELPEVDWEPAGKPGAGAGAGCAAKALLPGLAHLSEEAAGIAGIGSVSPLVLLAGEAPMRLRAKATDLSACEGAFVHRNRLLLFSHPPGDADAAKPDYRLAWRTEIPQTGDTFPPVWWVPAGTTLTLSFPDPPDTAGGGADGAAGGVPIHVDAASFSADPGPLTAVPAAARPALIAGGRRMPLLPAENGWVLDGAMAPVTGRWELQIAAPADGPTLAIRTLRVGDQAIIGAEPPLQIRLLDQPPAWDTAPPPLTAPFTVTGAPGDTCLDLLALLHLSNSALNRSHLPGCSPVQVTEDGRPLQPSREAPAAFRQQSGVYAHADQCLRLQPSGSSADDHRYAVALDPARDCGQFYWLYPGDTLRLGAKGAAMAKLRGPLTHLLLAGSVRLPEDTAGAAGGAAEEILSVRIVDGAGAVLYSGAIPVASLEGEGVRLALPTPLPRLLRDFRVELSSGPGAPFVVVKVATLEETLPTAGAVISAR